MKNTVLRVLTAYLPQVILVVATVLAAIIGAAEIFPPPHGRVLAVGTVL